MKFTDLELLFVERVLVDVLGPGSWKPATEPPLRNELVEADPCTPTVPEVDVSSSKPVRRKRKSLILMTMKWRSPARRMDKKPIVVQKTFSFEVFSKAKPDYKSF